ncbi:HEPN domain-containing protein [Candidatus Woesearchaeota archaeon]|nr:HEPN domain-containing protein [Candidatus Woesearchaeota archaeon]MBW3006488.1 HEPN domain-containing protein [Candidatus Woesearchaeota archaeon]
MGNKFLIKLKKEEKLELIEPSEEICESYTEKSANCLKSAKLLLANSLFENSVGMAYYAMYDLLIGLLFKAGIKCENHSGSILLLKVIFNQNGLFKTISDAKKERIDSQYYVTADEITKESTRELLGIAEDFILKMTLFIKNLNNEDIEKARKELTMLTQ